MDSGLVAICSLAATNNMCLDRTATTRVEGASCPAKCCSSHVFVACVANPVSSIPCQAKLITTVDPLSNPLTKEDSANGSIDFRKSTFRG